MTISVFDTYSLQSDLAANRPATPSTPNGILAIFAASDTGAVSVWNGSAWVVINSLASTALTDFSAGSWTPTDASGASLTFTSAVGTYIKIGKLVFVSYNVTYPSTANGSNAQIGNFPFTSLAAQTLSLANASIARAIEFILQTSSKQGPFFNISTSSFVTNANLTAGTINGFFVYSTP